MLLAVTGCFSSTMSITDTDVKEDDESVLKVYTDHRYSTHFDTGLDKQKMSA